MKLIISYRNGSRDCLPFNSAPEAYAKANRLSFSGGHISRVELDTGEGLRALWDSNWTVESQAAGLHMPA